MVSVAIALVILFNVVLVASGLAIVVYLVFGREPRAAGSGATADPDEWYAEAASLATDVRGVVEETEGITVADEESISRRLLPLSTRLRSHARAAPAGVEGDVVEDLHALGMDCYKVGMEHTSERAAQTGVFLADRLAQLDDAAAALLEALPGERG